MNMKKLFVIALAALATLTASAQTFGRVNFQELLMLAPEMDAAREAIAASQKEAEETYSAMVEEYQGKLTQYQQKQATWTAAIRESKERELMEIQNRIQEFQQSISQELQQQQNQLTAPIQEKVTKAITDIAKAKGLTAVFDLSQALYLDETKVIDLTPDARKALNIPADRTIESLQAELQAQAEAAQAPAAK
ncbi:MAG: OmpH family outer membrane protein [Bacteroidales bacterium]|jgi:outer membrane protein|nr:OmpH family outer membrane protein [Bacteroidales bacterium]